MILHVIPGHSSNQPLPAQPSQLVKHHVSFVPVESIASLVARLNSRPAAELASLLHIEAGDSQISSLCMLHCKERCTPEGSVAYAQMPVEGCGRPGCAGLLTEAACQGLGDTAGSVSHWSP